MRGELAVFVQENIEKHIMDEKAQRKTKISDIAYLTALMYPNAKWEQLKTMALLSLSMFVFDDTIDKKMDADNASDMPDYASDFDSATKLRKDSIRFMRHALGTESSSENNKDDGPPAPREFSAFADLAPRVKAAPAGQISIQRLDCDVTEFIETNGEEQMFRLSGKTPSIDEYWAYRHGVGAVFVYCTLHQHATSTI
ncbi:Uu.00g054800.m01.CDS01 [Anthostomella pinea]|uniref:Uu.00g054800.m01.CDS01 n=1 Tax=Anthostomella pinea TaxID=933095 RepID=A0AAI8VXL2_9PEZI|nr:Uu.00g054800.m01.CDS01 [Anthostomella pinea]